MLAPRINSVIVIACLTMPSMAEERPAETAKIRARTAEFTAALAKGDAGAVADLFTTGGEYIRDGGAIRGREALTKAYATFFEQNERGIEVEGKRLELRFPSENTAIDEGQFHSKNGAPSSYSILWAREGGEWRIAVLRESADTPTLADLEWLLGTWQVEGEGAKVRTTYRKEMGGAFIRMEYTVEADGEKTGGSQMIGVDPETGAIRSWLFGGGGGLGNGTWNRTAKGWEILSVGRTPDGEARTAVNVITLVDENSFTFQSTQRTVGGEAQPDGEAVTVRRSKSAK